MALQILDTFANHCKIKNVEVALILVEANAFINYQACKIKLLLSRLNF